MYSFTRVLFCLALSTAFVLSAGAQQPAAGQFDREREDVAAADIPKTNDINTVTRLARSLDPENVLRSDADKAMVDKVLKYYLYRLTWEEVQKERDPAKVGTIDSIMNELIGTVENSPRFLPPPFFGPPPSDQEMVQTRARQLGNVQQMTPIFIKHCKVVLQNRQPIARINAARVLAKLAEWGQETVVDELVNIIKNPNEIDAVRQYAFRGLEDIFNLQGANDPRAKGLFQSKDGMVRMTKALTAVYDWLDARTKVPDAKLKFMKQDEQAGLRYVRRTAERALGASRRPLIVDDRAAGKQQGPIAELLTKIVSADAGIVPAPDLRERLDTALALCQLRGDASPSYQPDYVAYQIGMFLTVMGAEANANMAAKGTSVLAWSSEANRLKAALDAFVKQRSAGPATGYLTNFMAKVNPLLEFFDDTSKNTDSVKSLNDWLRDNPPPSKQVYKAAGER